jgi:hypothetical protein
MTPKDFTKGMMRFVERVRREHRRRVLRDDARAPEGCSRSGRAFAAARTRKNARTSRQAAGLELYSAEDIRQDLST